PPSVSACVLSFPRLSLTSPHSLWLSPSLSSSLTLLLTASLQMHSLSLSLSLSPLSLSLPFFFSPPSVPVPPLLLLPLLFFISFLGSAPPIWRHRESSRTSQVIQRGV